jgi:plastocyanin
MRVLAAALAAVTILPVLSAEPASGASIGVSIVGVTSGFDPKTVTAALGDDVTWTNDDSIRHTTTQDGPLALWDSGGLDAGQTFGRTFTSAGAFPYHCSIHPTSMFGSVRVPVTATPTSGQVGTRFRITVASVAAPDGLVFDVQRRKGAGAWSAWKRDVTARAVRFTATSVGRWSFRARLRRTSNDATSGWSPAAKIRVR